MRHIGRRGDAPWIVPNAVENARGGSAITVWGGGRAALRRNDSRQGAQSWKQFVLIVSQGKTIRLIPCSFAAVLLLGCRFGGNLFGYNLFGCNLGLTHGAARVLFVLD